MKPWTRSTNPVLPAAVLCLALHPALAEAHGPEDPPVVFEETKLLAPDGAGDDIFGIAVSASGDRALVGANGDDVQGEDSGSAYVFERDATGSWLPVAKLRPAAGGTGSSFGRAVSLDGARALVGATGREAAHVFERHESGEWIEVAELAASDHGPHSFGMGVSLAADRAVVGAPLGDDQGTGTGAAYVFDRQGSGEWVEVAKLLASDGASHDYFAENVSLYGDRLLAGATGHDDLGDASGAAYVFERSESGAWLEVAELLASNGSEDDNFGSAVSLVGDRVLVGATRDGAPGLAYVFERDEAGVWVEVAELVAWDAEEVDTFGRSASLSGDRALVGEDFDEGTAYLFERRESGAWEGVARLLPSDGGGFLDPSFGSAVALSGDRAVVGARFDDDFGISSGSAYAFTVGGCVLELRLDPPRVRAGDELRLVLRLEHNRAETVTVPFVLWLEDDAGSVVVGTRTPPIAFHHGDAVRRDVTLTIPGEAPAGRYAVLVGVEQMQQGIAAARRSFEVVEPPVPPPSP